MPSKQPKLTDEQIKAVIANISLFDGREIYLGQMGNGLYLQVRYMEPDVETGKMSPQHARKWYISRYSTITEIVETAYKAIKTSYIHFVREHFLYKGHRVMSPHFDIEARVELCQNKRFEKRIGE